MEKIDVLCEEMMAIVYKKEQVQEKYNKRMGELNTYLKILFERVKELSATQFTKQTQGDK